MKFFFTVCIVGYNIAVAVKLILVGAKSFKAYRSSGMEFSGTDSDLGTETVSETVCKSG